jgi:hypothetical protein
MIPFEAPDKFSEVLIDKVLAETYPQPEVEDGVNSQEP